MGILTPSSVQSAGHTTAPMTCWYQPNPLMDADAHRGVKVDSQSALRSAAVAACVVVFSANRWRLFRLHILPAS